MSYNKYIRYNNEMRTIDSPDKAYLLGLFYSDGNVYLNPNTNGGVSRITLHCNDVKLLEDIKGKFPFFNIYESKGRDVSTLLCSKKQLALDLISNGCHPAKSFRNKDILVVPSLGAHLYRHFVRGVFDGDGGCTLSESGKKTQKRVYIYSNSIGFLNGIKDILSNNSIESTIVSGTPKNNGFSKDSVVHKLSISTKDYKSFYSFLYQNTTLLMERKIDKYNIILTTSFFTKRQTPPCPRCNAINTVSHGKYPSKPGYYILLCRSCNRTSICPLTW